MHCYSSCKLCLSSFPNFWLQAVEVDLGSAFPSSSREVEVRFGNQSSNWISSTIKPSNVSSIKFFSYKREIFRSKTLTQTQFSDLGTFSYGMAKKTTRLWEYRWSFGGLVGIDIWGLIRRVNTI